MNVNVNVKEKHHRFQHISTIHFNIKYIFQMRKVLFFYCDSYNLDGPLNEWILMKLHERRIFIDEWSDRSNMNICVSFYLNSFLIIHTNEIASLLSNVLNAYWNIFCKPWLFKSKHLTKLSRSPFQYHKKIHIKLKPVDWTKLWLNQNDLNVYKQIEPLRTLDTTRNSVAIAFGIG